MVDHPSTIGTADTFSSGIEWDDRAALHLANQGQGIFSEATALRRGSFAELIAQMMAMPEEERRKYVIEKAGDREYGPDEVAQLAAHPAFPLT